MYGSGPVTALCGGGCGRCVGADDCDGICAACRNEDRGDDWPPPAAGMERRMLSLTELIASDQDMREVLQNGRRSETPNEAIWVRARADGRGLEISDGHHRVAEAIRAGRRRVKADVDADPDDEPLCEPFYDFSADARPGNDR